MKTTSSPAASKCPRITQLQALKELRWPIADKLIDLRALALASIAILDNSEARATCESIGFATRLLSQLENEAKKFVDEVDAMYAQIEGANHV